MDHERYELFILFSSSSSSFILEPLFILKVYLLRRLAHRRFERKRRGMAIMFSSAASSSHPLFPNMFTPLDLGPNIEPLTNRVIMGSMHCGLEGHSIPKPLVYLLRSFAAKQKHSSSMEPSHQEQFGAYLAERAASGVSLIVTGGIAPNSTGALTPFGSKLTTQDEVAYQRVVTNAVHAANPSTKILMQILHAGRYANHPLLQAPSAVPSVLSPFTPRAMTKSHIQSTIQDYVACAQLANQSGYDGVEIMGSEGYLIHQFLCPKTNKRSDEYGGESYANRMRFALEIVREIRSKLPSNFIIVFRLSMLDLVDNTSTWEEIVMLAKELENAGVTILNTGIGWHEARVPTIATLVPRGAFAWVTSQMKTHLTTTPLCATNRINTPEKIEQILASGQADLVSMARPFLADPDFILKAKEMRQEEINTCIGCNQACLDHVFVGKRASCLVNPRACRELELPKIENLSKLSTENRLKVAVIGSGPAGLAAATTLAQLGQHVTLYDKSQQIGGQFNMAKRIPGKQEFYETLRYFDNMMNKHDVKRKLGVTVKSVADLVLDTDSDDVSSSTSSTPPDVIVLATGVLPRTPPIPNIYGHAKILSYVDVLARRVPVGNRVAVIGAGGIGVDIAEYLLHEQETNVDISLSQKSVEEEAKDVQKFFEEWNVDKTHWGTDSSIRGGLIPKERQIEHIPKRTVYLMQRKSGKIGASLGKTTGWIHRAQLAKGKVQLLPGCTYDRFDEDGNLHITIQGASKVLEVDNVIVCAGQDKCDELFLPLQSELAKLNGGQTYVIGGAQEASELDAKRAINMGVRLAYAIYRFGKDEQRILGALTEEEEIGDEQLMLRFLSKISGKKLG
mmetsp:Transcript_1391/g.2133  ORF Transcript_1391/g.2133 Transcript_1391/m.2133 type:complete len:849 (-) Transcript_1391:791-3337(-)